MRGTYVGKYIFLATSCSITGRISHKQIANSEYYHIIEYKIKDYVTRTEVRDSHSSSSCLDDILVHSPIPHTHIISYHPIHIHIYTYIHIYTVTVRKCFFDHRHCHILTYISDTSITHTNTQSTSS